MRWLREKAVLIFACLVVLYMLVPIFVIAVFSFNDPAGRFNFTWQGFTTEHWGNAFGIPELTDALLTSIELAAASTVISTILGTMIAMALVRYEFRGRKATNLLIVIPITSPEVVIGAAAFLAFALSLDDFVISNFNSGTTVTFPLYIFGAAQRGIPVEVNVLATMLFLVTLVAMGVTVWQQRKAEKLAAVRPDEDADTGFPAAKEPAATPGSAA